VDFSPRLRAAALIYFADEILYSTGRRDATEQPVLGHTAVDGRFPGMRSMRQVADLTQQLWRVAVPPRQRAAGDTTFAFR
jgi:hypothetical protein